jgi:hypothetical protein
MAPELWVDRGVEEGRRGARNGGDLVQRTCAAEGGCRSTFWLIKGRNIDCSLTDMFAKNDEFFFSFEIFAEEYLGIGALPVTPSLQSSKVVNS